MMTRFLWGCWIKPVLECQVLLENPGQPGVQGVQWGVQFDEIRRISNDLAGFVLAGDSDDVS